VSWRKGIKILCHNGRDAEKGVEGIVLRKGGDVGRHGGSGEVVCRIMQSDKVVARGVEKSENMAWFH
jgi:hypothetical protein